MILWLINIGQHCTYAVAPDVAYLPHITLINKEMRDKQGDALWVIVNKITYLEIPWMYFCQYFGICTCFRFSYCTLQKFYTTMSRLLQLAF